MRIIAKTRTDAAPVTFAGQCLIWYTVPLEAVENLPRALKHGTSQYPHVCTKAHPGKRHWCRCGVSHALIGSELDPAPPAG